MNDLKRGHDVDSGSRKKVKEIPFSSSEYLKDKICIGDKTASIVGYVEEIQGESTHYNREKQSEFRVFKFLLNNNDGCTVACHIYNQYIEKFKSNPFLKLNQKIVIENALVVAAKYYSKGNLPWNLNFQFYTTIIDLGPFTLSRNIQKIKFNELVSKRGMIKIVGFLRNPFVQKQENNDYEFISTIAYKKSKLDVVLLKDEDRSINFVKGSKLELMGDLQESGKTVVLRVKSIDHIKILSDDDHMDDQELLAATEIVTVQNTDEIE